MKGFLNIYRREWIGLLVLTMVFVVSAFLATREYGRFERNVYLSGRLKQELRVAEEVLRRLENYDRHPFWRHLSPPQEVKIYEKLGLRPFEEAIYKLSNLYVERGFFFLDKFELRTCLGEKRGVRRSRPSCVPHFYVTGRKVLF